MAKSVFFILFGLHEWLFYELFQQRFYSLRFTFRVLLIGIETVLISSTAHVFLTVSYSKVNVDWDNSNPKENKFYKCFLIHSVGVMSYSSLKAA
jgi:hypothetical protein